MVSVWLFFVLYFLALNSRLSESFKWTRNQQTSRVINAQLGSDVSLPCEFLLTSDEESAMQQFHLIYWTRETPAGSQSWQGIASKTNLISNSEPRFRIIYHDKSRIVMNNNSLKILSVQEEDAALYQCEVKSSFYTTPSVIKLNVLAHMKTAANKQHSKLSNGASAGIGVGVTLLVMALIIIGALLLCKANISRARQRTSSVRGTNMEYFQRHNGNIVEAYENPAALQNNEMISNGATNNLYRTCSLDGKTISVTSF